ILAIHEHNGSTSYGRAEARTRVHDEHSLSNFLILPATRGGSEGEKRGRIHRGCVPHLPCGRLTGATLRRQWNRLIHRRPRRAPPQVVAAAAGLRESRPPPER